MKYIGPDFYNITELLTEEELAIQKTAHDFVKSEFWKSKVDDMREIYIPSGETYVYEEEGDN